MKMKLVAGIMCGLLTLGMAGASAANANLVVNGSFEDGDYTGANWSWKTLYAGDTSLTGWDIGGVGVDWHSPAEFSPIMFGEKALDLNLNGVTDSGILSQSFATDPGEWYTLKFYMAAPGQFDASREVKVDVAGVEKTFSMPSAYNLGLTWEEFSLNFLAADVNTRLAFSSASGAYWGPVLDNVSVDHAVVTPEPASVVLFSLGGAAMAFARRRMKTNA